ncbi:MAG TPA: hypothetical protein VLA24_10685 [Pseudomonadales bacterium]|nr:hypothetical protein [Pseudomonadales bacterium]
MNAQIEHTPGPWRIVACPCQYENCTTYGLSNGLFSQGCGFSKADAMLAAAAPDLLAALQRTLNWLKYYPGRVADGAYNQARAAIDKATKE